MITFGKIVYDMNYEVYCDESCVEALFDKESHKYAVIGGIWIPSESRGELKTVLNNIKQKYNLPGEMKWQKISPSTVDMYKEVINTFFASENIRFRAICINSAILDHNKFNQGSGELGFYKFYYLLIQRWLVNENAYNIFVDYKVNGNRHRVKDLGRMLQRTTMATVNQTQALPSHESILIQLADILSGAVASAYNNENTSEAKLTIRSLIEESLGHKITGTTRQEQKFNIFDINLKKGGW